MKSRRAFSEQLALRFAPASGLPFAVSPRAVRLAVRRALADDPSGDVGRLEAVARLRILRRKYRTAVREERNAAVFAASPEGRRAHAALDALVMKLCG